MGPAMEVIKRVLSDLYLIIQIGGEPFSYCYRSARKCGSGLFHPIHLYLAVGECNGRRPRYVKCSDQLGASFIRPGNTVMEILNKEVMSNSGKNWNLRKKEIAGWYDQM